jgi:hypothetical protein
MVIVAEDLASKMTAGDGNGCGVPSPVLRLPYIRPGCCESLHRRIASAGGANFFKAALFLLVSVSGGVTAMLGHHLLRTGRQEAAGGA